METRDLGQPEMCSPENFYHVEFSFDCADAREAHLIGQRLTIYQMVDPENQRYKITGERTVSDYDRAQHGIAARAGPADVGWDACKNPETYDITRTGMRGRGGTKVDKDVKEGLGESEEAIPEPEA